MTTLLSSLGLWLKIFLLGWGALGLAPESLFDRGPRWKSWLAAGAVAAALGILLTSLTTLALGAFGLFTLKIELAVRGFLFLALLSLSVGRDPAGYAGRLRASLPVATLLLAGIATVLMLPNRGEWIAGGWDPGVYANEASALSRTGSFRPPDPVFHTELTEAEREAFTRSGRGRTERFPGVLVDRPHQSFTFEFFRLTPALFAAFHRSGGMAGLLAANAVLMLVAILLFAALALRRFGLPQAVMGSMLFALHPILLYHSHVPVTEMLQLVLLLTALLLATEPPRGAATAWTALLLMGAIFNRFSELPFAGLLLVCLALAESAEPDRRAALRRRLILLAACMLAGLVDYLIAPHSILGWADTRMILVVFASCAVLALALDAAFSIPALRARAATPPTLLLDAFALLIPLGLLATWLLRREVGRSHDVDNLLRLLPFNGLAAMALAAVGILVLLLVRPRTDRRILLPIVMFLLASAWLLILRKNIVDLYPWATRRFLPYLVPLLALGAGSALAALWNVRRWRPLGPVAAMLLLGCALAERLPASRRAWLYTEYNGAVAALEGLARQLQRGDIVVADHPKWGTPLALIHGFDTFNGREIWKDPQGAKVAVITAALDRLHASGRRIRFITTTSQGMGLYPVPPEATRKDWASPPWVHQEIAHHKRAWRYELSTRETTFTLHTLVAPIHPAVE